MRRINILLLFAFISLWSYAQDTLHFVRTSYNVAFVDTSLSFTISDSLYAIGAPVTGDSIGYGATLNAAPLSSAYYQNTSTPVLPPDTLYPGIGSYKSVNIKVDTAPQFIIGPNTIVIWPIIYHNNVVLPGIPVDSIHINVNYSTIQAGISESSLLRMYIFQTPGHLNVNFGDAENLVQQVRICDILGQGMYTGPADRSQNIPTAGWNAGIYLCEITTLAGEKRTIKFRME